MRLTTLFNIFLLVLLLFPQTMVAHGNEEEEPQSDPVSLSLESILLITILMGIVLLYLLFTIIGIEDRELLYKMAAITMILLAIDYTYIRFFR